MVVGRTDLNQLLQSFDATVEEADLPAGLLHPITEVKNVIAKNLAVLANMERDFDRMAAKSRESTDLQVVVL